MKKRKQGEQKARKGNSMKYAVVTGVVSGTTKAFILEFIIQPVKDLWKDLFNS
jgi:hypothetical protein